MISCDIELVSHAAQTRHSRVRIVPQRVIAPCRIICTWDSCLSFLAAIAAQEQRGETPPAEEPKRRGSRIDGADLRRETIFDIFSGDG